MINEPKGSRTALLSEVYPAAVAIILTSLLSCVATTVRASETSATTLTTSDLSEFSIEDLMHVKVISASKRPENLFDAPAAIHVITQEDLRRSGVTTISDALRTVPGMDVAHPDSHTWAVSARGFNGEFASKLLVLVDGRSVYTPLFSGVYWDIQDTVLEDIDRIEVVRGPGGTLWGANAVNGVINIITKSARETPGLLLSAGGGTEERGFGTVRYGDKLAENVYCRVYARYFNRDDSALPNGSDADDSWWMGRGGFRVDWDASENNLLTLQGDAYQGQTRQTRTVAIPGAPFVQTANFDDHVSGGNVLGRWSHVCSDAADFKLQVYYDRTERESPIPREKRDTFDIDFQNQFPLCDWQDIVWGAGYRVTRDDIRNGFAVSLMPKSRTMHLFNTFVQDEITLVTDRLRLTLGSKCEHNDFTGFEIQPTGRLAWTPTERQTVWAAVSRAIRTPSRAEDDARINLPVAPAVPVVVSIVGDRDGESEELLAYEIGYRVIPHERATLDLTAFYSVYDDLRSLEPTAPPPPPPVAAAALASANKLNGETYGVEAAVQWKPLDHWRLQAAYTFLEVALHRDDSGRDSATESFFEGNSPHHQFSLRSSLDLPWHLQFDTTVRYVDNLRNPRIPSYVVADVRLGWQPKPNLELALVAQNLLDDQHPEFGPAVIATPQTEVEQSVYVKVTWRF